MKVQHDNGKKRTWWVFGKDPDHLKLPKMYKRSEVFGPGSKSALRILIIFSVKVVLSSVLQPAKTVCLKKHFFSRFLRSNLDHSIGVVIPCAKMSLNMC